MQVSYDQVKNATVQLAGLTPIGCVYRAFTIPGSEDHCPAFLRHDFHIYFKDDRPLACVSNAKEAATILTGAIMAELHEKHHYVSDFNGLHLLDHHEPGDCGSTLVANSEHTHPFDALIDLYVKYRKSIDKPKFELMPNPFSVWRTTMGHDVVIQYKGDKCMMHRGVGKSLLECTSQGGFNELKGTCLFEGIPPETERRWTK